MSIRWDKLTLKAQAAVQQATEMAAAHGNPELAPVHLLAALAGDQEGIVAPVLSKIGVNAQAVLADAQREVERLPKMSGSGARQAHLSDALTQAMERAFQEAADFQDEYISTDLKRLLADRRISLELSDTAHDLLFAEGCDPSYGARPLKRAIQRLIQDPLALRILDGEVQHGDHVVVDADAKTRKMTFKVASRTEEKQKATA